MIQKVPFCEEKIAQNDTDFLIKTIDRKKSHILEKKQYIY